MTADTERLLYYDIDSRAVAFSTTRHGGVSTGNYSSFNINSFCGDSMENVNENKALLAGELGLPASRVLVPHQVHGTDCRIITAAHAHMADDELFADLDGVDALVTAERNIVIGVSTADCIPVLLFDTKRNVAAAVHAGWRGTVKNIVAAALNVMTGEFGSAPADVKAVIGPGISMKNFEVGQEVFDKFDKQGYDMTRISRMFNKWHIDLPLCNELQLEACGVKKANIRQTGICTYDNVDTFFSARRLGTASGRIYSGIMLK